MAGPPVRERYNSKARGSTAGGGSHKKRKRPSKAAPPADVNAEDGEDGQQTAHAEVEREKLPMEGEGRGGMSAKKRKRMDSYIVSFCSSSLPLWHFNHPPEAGQRASRADNDRTRSSRRNPDLRLSSSSPLSPRLLPHQATSSLPPPWVRARLTQFRRASGKRSEKTSSCGEGLIG